MNANWPKRSVDLTKSWFRYVRAHRVPFLIVATCLIGLFGAGLSGLYDLKPFIAFWSAQGSHMLGIATFVVAFFVWFGELREDWHRALPCKLTVRYRYEGRVVMSCRYADLASEGDMRALGQQIGMQMADVKLLQFIAPQIKRWGGDVETDADGQVFRHFVIQFDLIELPATIAENQMLLWEPPFDCRPRLVSTEPEPESPCVAAVAEEMA